MNKTTPFDKLLEVHVHAIIQSTKTSSGGRWPMPIFKSSLPISFYSASWTVSDFMALTGKLLDEGKSYKEIGELYKDPTILARFMHLMPSRNLWFMSREKYAEVGDRLASIMETMYKNHPFCEDEIYLPYEGTIQEKIITQNQKIDPAVARRLNGLLWMLAESYSPRFHNIFYDFSGPYNLNGSNIILKEYTDLKPKFLKLEFDYNFDNISIIEIYPKKVEIKFDIANRIASFQSFGQIADYQILIDGKPANNEQIIDATKKITSALQKSAQRLAQMNKKDMILYNATLERYAFIYPLDSNLGLSLPNEMLESIENPDDEIKREKLIEWYDSIEKNYEGWKLIFDPRIVPKAL